MRKQRNLLLVSLLVSLSTANFKCFGEDNAPAEPGPALEVRQSLLRSIGAAEKLGVGVKPYRDAFESIENRVKSNAPADEIAKEAERIHRALQEQITAAQKRGGAAGTTAPKAPNSGSTGPSLNLGDRSNYYDTVQALIEPRVKRITSAHPPVVAVTVDADGNIIEFNIPQANRADEAAKAKALAYVKALKKLPKPPQATKLGITFPISEYEDVVEVSAWDVDFGPYMADLQRRIKKHWFPPRGNESKRVEVRFDVSRDGLLSNLHLSKSSTVAIADNAALKAVEDAAPFRPLPYGSPKRAHIDFTFDYNAFNHGSFRQF